MSSTTKKSIDIKKSLVEAILAGLIALIVFGPIVGVVLEGYSFNLEPTRVAWNFRISRTFTRSGSIRALKKPKKHGVHGRSAQSTMRR